LDRGQLQQQIFEKAVVCGHHDERDESFRNKPSLPRPPSSYCA